MSEQEGGHEHRINLSPGAASLTPSTAYLLDALVIEPVRKDAFALGADLAEFLGRESAQQLDGLLERFARSLDGEDGEALRSLHPIEAMLLGQLRNGVWFGSIIRPKFRGLRQEQGETGSEEATEP